MQITFLRCYAAAMNRLVLEGGDLVLSGPQTLLAVWETTVGGQPSPGRMASPRMEECFTCDLCGLGPSPVRLR